MNQDELSARIARATGRKVAGRTDGPERSYYTELAGTGPKDITLRFDPVTGECINGPQGRGPEPHVSSASRGETFSLAGGRLALVKTRFGVSLHVGNWPGRKPDAPVPERHVSAVLYEALTEEKAAQAEQEKS